MFGSRASSTSQRANQDGGADPDPFLADVLAGLSEQPKQIPSKYLYDDAGSALFDRICELSEYYPTRTELGILRDYAPEMGECLGPACVLIEYGSGSSNKTHALVECVQRPLLYAPLDISESHLLAAAARVAEAFPDINVHPIHGDFTAHYEVPEPPWPVRRSVAYFPGSTIGNFMPDGARELLRSIARVVGPGGGLLIGVDLRKPRDVLERAYDDAAGVTAAFNRNMLARINRELEADFAIERFRHRARWNQREGRMEMHLESAVAQTVTVGGERFRFERGETICTEYSYKYRQEDFAALAESAGFDVERTWTDVDGWFSVQYLETR